MAKRVKKSSSDGSEQNVDAARQLPADKQALPEIGVARSLEPTEGVSGGSGSAVSAISCMARSLTPTEIDAFCVSLQEAQVERKFSIQMEMGIMQRISSRAVRAVGLASDASETERASAWRRAERIVRRGLKGDAQAEEDAAVALALTEHFKVTAAAVAPVIAFRERVEARMRDWAAKLPGFPLTERTAGFKAIGLAVIIGETGNLSNYATVRKLWRRLGFGVAPGHEAHAYSTWRMKGGLTADDWTTAGYSPKRLGQIHGVVTVPLVMNKDKNKYGEVYAKRRAHTAITHPTGTLAQCKADPTMWTPGHSHADAMRVMTKTLISDLWSEWRGSAGFMASDAPVATMAPADHSAGMLEAAA